MSLHTKEQVQTEIEAHVQKILLTQDKEGMIPSQMDFTSREILKKKDIPRQSMATMALSFARTLIPSLTINIPLELSYKYIKTNLEEEPPVNLLFSSLYLTLAKIYSHEDASEPLQNLGAHYSQEIFKYPIAANLYLRISSLLPTPLPEATYVAETQRYAALLSPRPGRFFDYSDILVWAKQEDSALAQHEHTYIIHSKTKDGWFADNRTGVPATASIVGKFFEVLTYYEHDVFLVETLYEKLVSHVSTSQYAKDSLGLYHEHIISEADTLRIDDVHMHILIGLCYRYQQLMRGE